MKTGSFQLKISDLSISLDETGIIFSHLLSRQSTEDFKNTW